MIESNTIVCVWVHVCVCVQTCARTRTVVHFSSPLNHMSSIYQPDCRYKLIFQILSYGNHIKARSTLLQM